MGIGNLKQVIQKPHIFANQIGTPILILPFVRNSKDHSLDHKDHSVQNTVNISNKSVIMFQLQ